jgi:hypothetical protein
VRGRAVRTLSRRQPHADSRLWPERTAVGQARARPPPEPEGINSGPNLPGQAHSKQAKEVFEMAASLIIEQESGTYTAGFRHPHNGYYAGDFSQTSRAGSEPRVPDAERRDVPRTWQ